MQPDEVRPLPAPQIASVIDTRHYLSQRVAIFRRSGPGIEAETSALRCGSVGHRRAVRSELDMDYGVSLRAATLTDMAHDPRIFLPRYQRR